MAENKSDWLEQIRRAIPADLWEQIKDDLGKFTQAEVAALVERIRAGSVRAAYAEVYARLGPGDAIDAWDALNAKWQALNEDQWNRLQTARAITLGILEAAAKLALLGVFL